MQKIIFIFIASSSLLYCADAGYDTDKSNGSVEKTLKKLCFQETPSSATPVCLSVEFAQLSVRSSDVKAPTPTKGQKRTWDAVCHDEATQYKQFLLEQDPCTLRIEYIKRLLARVSPRIAWHHQHRIAKLQEELLRKK